MKQCITVLAGATAATLADLQAEDSGLGSLESQHSVLVAGSSDGIEEPSAVDPLTVDPNTIEKGHWEIDNVVVGYSKDRSSGTKTETWTFAETTLKYGISDDMDLQVTWAPSIYERSTSGGVTETLEDSSDLTFGLRWSLWGGDGVDSAFSLLPYVVAPTGSGFGSDEWEGGLILPYTLDLEGPWSLGLQLEFAYTDDLDVAHTAVVGYELNDKVGFYAEHIGVIGEEYESFASAGALYIMTETLEWFLGAEVGLNDNSEDLGLFTGFTVGF